ncbi:GNAT family N-acetyltransferase [Hyphomonas sediminis]|uniref:GNAT family N-acetyltransferase n=1 Tax=Hyphomonas sediminis TaxID=2866160 RepID=UPI001CED9E9C|nr:N-acetyltransferase [Hyphomonas sediminis]
MSRYPSIGELVLARPLPEGALETYSARPARTLEEYQQAMAIRAAVYMAEQDCPYDEEYDGNDFTATHMVVYAGARPIGAIRVRWFSGFAKVERTSILPSFRGTAALKVLLAETFEIIARKGYRLALAQIQARLWPTWSRVFRCRLVIEREGFAFSGFEYAEMEIPVPRHPEVLGVRADPLQVIRPEGAWDDMGVLDKSAGRPTDGAKAA